jgi:hypothetical protein
MKKKIVIIGLHPDVVNYSLFPGLPSDGPGDLPLTHEKLTQGLKAQEEGLQKLGFDVRMCFVDLGETAEEITREALLGKAIDAVLIGAGIRTPPPNFLLFERLVNVVHECAPQAKICFNTNPEDTAEAFLRGVKP